MEGRAVIRAKSLVQLSSYSLGSLQRQGPLQSSTLDDDKVGANLLEIASLTGSLHLGKGTERFIRQLAGYLVRPAPRRISVALVPVSWHSFFSF